MPDVKTPFFFAGMTLCVKIQSLSLRNTKMYSAIIHNNLSLSGAHNRRRSGPIMEKFSWSNQCVHSPRMASHLGFDFIAAAVPTCPRPMGAGTCGQGGTRSGG